MLAALLAVCAPACDAGSRFSHRWSTSAAPIRGPADSDTVASRLTFPPIRVYIRLSTFMRILI
jgi:hypothetical protein